MRLLLIALIFAITCCSERQKKNIFVVKYEHVDYLTSSSPVLYNGATVGKIKSLKVLESTDILVELEIDADVRVTEETTFAIVRFNSFGMRAIELVGTGDGRLLNPEDTVKGLLVKRAPIQQLDSVQVQIILDSVLRIQRQD